MSVIVAKSTLAVNEPGAARPTDVEPVPRADKARIDAVIDADLTMTWRVFGRELGSCARSVGYLGRTWTSATRRSCVK